MATTVEIKKVRQQIEFEQVQAQLRVAKNQNKCLERKEKLFEQYASFSYTGPPDFDRTIEPALASWTAPLWSRDLYPYKPTTIRTQLQLDMQRNLARILAETDPNAVAILTGFRSYCVGSGLTYVIDGSEQLIQRGTKYLAKFDKVNQMKDVAYEILWRFIRDGEFFIRIEPGERGISWIRFIEPDQIRAPAGEMTDGIPEFAPYAWGILTENHDTLNPLRYCIWYSDSEQEEVEPQYIIHKKANVDMNRKRGLSYFYPCHMILQNVAKLRRSNAIGNSVREAIAYFRQWEVMPEEPPNLNNIPIPSWVKQDWNPDGKQYPVGVQYEEAGTIKDIPRGMTLPSQSDMGPDPVSCDLAIKHGLRASAARMQAPYWMVSGDADTSSYAASLTAESPFIHTIQFLQSVITDTVREIYERVLAHGEEQLLLPESIGDRVTVEVSAPSPVARDRVKEVQADALLVKMGAMSIPTLQSKHGLDPEVEKAQGAAPQPNLEIGDEKKPETVSGQRQRDEGVRA